MTVDQILTLVLSSVAILIIPTLILMIRIAMRYQKMDDRILSIEEKSLDIQKRMDVRLRWLEENVWKRR